MHAGKWQHDVVELMEAYEPGLPGSSYKVPWNSVAKVKALLGEKGAEGWELVSTTPKTDIYGCTRKVVLWFKRPAN